MGTKPQRKKKKQNKLKMNLLSCKKKGISGVRTFLLHACRFDFFKNAAVGGSTRDAEPERGRSLKEDR